MDLHWKVVSPEMREVLQEVSRLPLAARFYLAGGTALALQYGHRRSVDLDYFSETDVVHEDTHAEVQDAFRGRADVVFNRAPVWGMIELEVRGVRTGFFSYGYPLLEPPIEVEGSRLSRPLDIGLMKLDALISRGARKDFIDLYFIAKQLTLDHLLAEMPKKYHGFRDLPTMAVRSLTYFENAEKPQEVEMMAGVTWEEIKGFFELEARRLARDWFGP